MDVPVLQCVVDGELAKVVGEEPLRFALAEAAQMASEPPMKFELPEGKWLRVTVEVIDKPEMP